MKRKQSKFVGRFFCGGWLCVGVRVESVSPAGKKTYAYEVVNRDGKSAWLDHSQIRACSEGIDAVDDILAERRERFLARNARKRA